MENENKVIHDRINNLEGRVGKVEDRVEVVDEKHDNRHTENVRIITEMQADNKANRDSNARLTKSIEDLVTELKESNGQNNTKFERLGKDIGDIKNKFEDKTLAMNIKLEEKRMSNTTLGLIIGGVFTIIQVAIQFLPPLFIK